jgi:glycosyltransferase involved in cell wall biosynthesis
MLRWGVDVHVWRMVMPASPHPTDVRVHDGSLADAVRRVNPDVIHIHWLGFALSQGDMLAELGVPVTIRLHGFDVTAERLNKMLEQSWLHAIYGFPCQMGLLENPDTRLRSIAAAFDTSLFRPREQKDRRMVIRTSAALPSKDIGFFFHLAKLCPDYRFVFAGVTCNEFESYVDCLRELAASMDSPVELLFDLPRDVVAELVAQAAIYVHTIHPPGMEFGAPIGMPISIAEAMATGAHVLVRDLMELREYVGDAGTIYRDLDSAAEIIAATAGWSDEQWRRAWTRSVDRAYMQHADEIVLRPVFEDWCGLVQPDKRKVGATLA